MILALLLLAQPIDCDRQPEACISNSVRHDICDESEELADPAACLRAERDFLIDPRERDRLCRAEIIAAKEGLIGTAPRPGEEGIGEANPTPMCSPLRSANRRNE